MATLNPQGNNNGEEPMIGKAHRDKVISTFPLSKQFMIRTQLNNTENLRREEAIELLKDCIVQLAQKDAVFAELMKTSF